MIQSIGKLSKRQKKKVCRVKNFFICFIMDNQPVQFELFPGNSLTMCYFTDVQDLGDLDVSSLMKSNTLVVINADLVCDT